MCVQESNDHLKLASPLKLLATGSSFQAGWYLKLLANVSSVKVLGAQGNHICVCESMRKLKKQSK